MQVVPWSQTQKDGDGCYDHGFLFQGDLEWLLGTYCLVIRDRWPRALIHSDDDATNTGKEYPAPAIPKSFHREGLLLFHRDQRMVKFAGKHGRGSDASGESYLTLWIWPNESGSHLDLVTTEPLSHPFTSWAVGSLVELIGWWYHVRWSANHPSCMPPGRSVVREHALQFVGRGGRFVKKTDSSGK